jgi:hypothetical protein
VSDPSGSDVQHGTPLGDGGRIEHRIGCGADPRLQRRSPAVPGWRGGLPLGQCGGLVGQRVELRCHQIPLLQLDLDPAEQVGATRGKSAFVRAGLLPRLARENSGYVELDIVRPRRDPLSGDTGLPAAIRSVRQSFDLSQPALGETEAACHEGDPALVAGWLSEVRATAAEGVLDTTAEALANLNPAQVHPRVSLPLQI